MNKAEFLRRFQHVRTVTLEPDYPLTRRGRDAAVLIPLVEKSDGLHVMLTERAHHLRHHPGQISFPGGGFDNTDKNLLETAKREAREEVGLPDKNIQIVGSLPVYRTVSGYQITPVVGFIDPDFEYVLDANEVASVFDAPLAHVANKQNHMVHYSHRAGRTFPIYFIPWRQRMIWGATAAILRNLSHHLE